MRCVKSEVWVLRRFATLQDGIAVNGSGHVGYTLLTEENGCRNGCVCGISHYYEMEYQKPGQHEDQEGFVVLAGCGMAQIGTQEEEVFPGKVFIVPPHELHAIRTFDSKILVEVFWFHAAV